MYRVNHRQVLLSLQSCATATRRPSRPYSRKASLASNQGDPRLDFRAFVEVLRKDGDLVDVNQEVDANLEVGAIVRRVSETNAKAPLFHNVKGARDGLWKIFGNAASLRRDQRFRYGRIARSLGLPPDSNWKSILDKMRHASHRDPSPANILPTGLCKQNKIFGNDIDLTTLPVPLLHKDDGGKYLQTWGLHVLQTPDASWTNWSIFRGMVHDKRRLACLVIPGQHNSMIREQWAREGKDQIPWALVLGAPPAASIAASIPLPSGVSEGDYVSALTGKSLDMVKCELSNLLVPASSEIVLEGTFSLKDKGIEGPFEDYIGLHVEGESGQQPLFTVNAITHRHNAILPVSVPGRITDESHTTASMASVQLLELLQEHNIPVKDAFAPFQTIATWCVLQVDIEKLGEMKTNPNELCTRIGNLAFNSKATMLMNRILLVGDDVDIHNWDDVIWAYTSRCRPGLDEYVFDDVRGLPLIPYLKYGRESAAKGDFRSSYPHELQEKVQAEWTQMGFDAED
ncbi:UbiD decarboxylyase family [Macrophomina phaseolina]|uniref:Ferulic acid decarboxylase 1 n=1 Tax=Macrophomina phaseolina TaxID=35725 RepID=A0ABQ8FXM5_9PEZI|nr:UbiD decarboxylyase family [Macrophomina phaseolina]